MADYSPNLRERRIRRRMRHFTKHASIWRAGKTFSEGKDCPAHGGNHEPVKSTDSSLHLRREVPLRSRFAHSTLICLSRPLITKYILYASEHPRVRCPTVIKHLSRHDLSDDGERKRSQYLPPVVDPGRTLPLAYGRYKRSFDTLDDCRVARCGVSQSTGIGTFSLGARTFSVLPTPLHTHSYPLFYCTGPVT